MSLYLRETKLCIKTQRLGVKNKYRGSAIQIKRLGMDMMRLADFCFKLSNNKFSIYIQSHRELFHPNKWFMYTHLRAIFPTSLKYLFPV